ncbi:MAG: chromate transporter [Clostridia bacterium]|nr:chromate transporter [Clostridia bacterium]
MPLILDLFLTFLKVGAVSFGGGYGMISLLSEEVVSHGWLTKNQMLDFIAVSESTPGPIAINMATFIGSSQAGIWGSIVATIGIVLPSFIIILLIASVISGLLKLAGVKSFLDGVRPVVVGLIVATGLMMILSVLFSIETVKDAFVFDWKALVIFSIIAIIFFVYKYIKKKNVSPILLIIISAILGMIFYGLI